MVISFYSRCRKIRASAVISSSILLWSRLLWMQWGCKKWDGEGFFWSYRRYLRQYHDDSPRSSVISDMDNYKFLGHELWSSGREFNLKLPTADAVSIGNTPWLSRQAAWQVWVAGWIGIQFWHRTTTAWTVLFAGCETAVRVILTSLRPRPSAVRNCRSQPPHKMSVIPGSSSIFCSSLDNSRSSPSSALRVYQISNSHYHHARDLHMTWAQLHPQSDERPQCSPSLIGAHNYDCIVAEMIYILLQSKRFGDFEIFRPQITWLCSTAINVVSGCVQRQRNGFAEYGSSPIVDSKFVIVSVFSSFSPSSFTFYCKRGFVNGTMEWRWWVIHFETVCFSFEYNCSK